MKLYTAGTPNGWKISIMLEGLVEAGDLTEKFEVHSIDLMEGHTGAGNSSYTRRTWRVLKGTLKTA